MTTITLSNLKKCKTSQQKFAVLTAYDSTFARLADQAGIEVLLVGDSLGNVCLGYGNTVPVSVDDMVHHTQAVSRGNSNALVVADLPYMAYAEENQALLNATRLMQAGANVVKLEGGEWLIPTVQKLSDRGVPVCGHLGLTPQSVDKLGGFKVQGRDDLDARKMIADARALEDAGAELLVIECVPTSLAKDITDALSIPVIGIGAGNVTDAQVLVVYDMLGISPRIPKFSRNFLAGQNSIQDAFKAYADAVRSGNFPDDSESF
jgi:3-methyl-2-oxobutanoate hydroxymethyltransferase